MNTGAYSHILLLLKKVLHRMTPYASWHVSKTRELLVLQCYANICRVADHKGMHMYATFTVCNEMQLYAAFHTRAYSMQENAKEYEKCIHMHSNNIDVYSVV